MTGKTGARPGPRAKKAAPVREATPVKQAASKPPQAADEPDAVTARNADEPAVHRAGGWIDRGDGRGWELEEGEN